MVQIKLLVGTFVFILFGLVSQAQAKVGADTITLGNIAHSVYLADLFNTSDEVKGERDIAAEATRTRRRRRRTTRKRRRGKSRSCPFGHGPMRHGKCRSKQKNDIIASLLGHRAASCYSKLFVAESGGSCKPSLYHDPVKAKNPHVGFGICAIEKSRRIRQRNRRGKNCLAKDIYKSFSRQVLCCRDMVQKTRSAYFGTIKCGKTPNCYGLSRGGGSIKDTPRFTPRDQDEDVASNGNYNNRGKRFCKVGKYYWPARDCRGRKLRYMKKGNRYVRATASNSSTKKRSRKRKYRVGRARYCKVGGYYWHSRYCGNRRVAYAKSRSGYVRIN